MPVSGSQPTTSKATAGRRSASDVLLLFGGGLLATGGLLAVIALSEKYGVPAFWISAPPIGAVFFAYFVRDIRSKLKKRPSVLVFLSWFVVHMAVTLLSAAKLQLIPAILAVGFELWICGAIVNWLYRYRPSSKDAKQQPR